MDCITPGFPVLHNSWSLLIFTFIDILCHPLLLHSIFPNIRVFCNESVLQWAKYWNFSFSITPSSEYSGLISFRIDWFDLPAVKGLSRVFSSNMIWKYQFFSGQPSLWSQLSHPYMTAGKAIALTIGHFSHRDITLLASDVSAFSYTV